MKKKVTLSLEKESWQDLKILCARLEKIPSKVIDKLISKFLANPKIIEDSSYLEEELKQNGYIT
jgi:hypothetical protein